ncbi:MAG: 16S rRNA (cytidine(1402)-2'-O)-methyltransferase [Acidobacteriota bacterium]|jgi:16S rRNA (cytidine1402-2'-O)-methyltransferase
MSDENRQKKPPAGLYLVATPIGNLDDITLRALAILRGVELVLAEDTRRTRKLLSHFDIRTRLLSLHEHNETARTPRLVERLSAGESMALVSDAGTPLISDPGHELVRAAIDAGVAVVPVPGPSALLAALTASGLPLDRFTFVGYLPRKRGARERLFEELAADPGTLVFLESPRRLARSLADAAGVLGGRPVVVARELTKVHEELVRGTLPEIAARFAQAEVRGEVIVCVAGRDSAADSDADPSRGRGELDRDALRHRYEELLAGGTARNDALRRIAAENGVKRRDVYELLMIET